EAAGVEWGEVGDLLPGAHELDWQAELVANGEDDAALGGAVELCHDKARYRTDFGELLGLDERVLAARRIHDQQDLMRGAGKALAGHAGNLAQLFHEVELSVQPARGVG